MYNSQNMKSLIKSSSKANKLSDECEEWLDIMKNVNLHPDEFEKFSRNKMLSKLIEAIEMLNRLIMDKNLQIRVFDTENESLNLKNRDLNNENMSLIANNAELFSSYNNMKIKLNTIEGNKYEKLLIKENLKVKKIFFL